MWGVMLVRSEQNSLISERMGLTMSERFSRRSSELRSTVQRPISMISLIWPRGGRVSQQVDSTSMTSARSSRLAMRNSSPSPWPLPKESENRLHHLHDRENCPIDSHDQ